MADTYIIAVISDIHSNFVALKAVFEELSNIDIDDIVIAGDIIGGFLQPNQTVELVQKANAKVIHGNREDYLRYYNDGTHNNWDQYYQMLPVVWMHRKLTKNNMNYLFDLPNQITFDVNDTKFRVVHGSFRKTNELIYKHETKKIEKVLANVEEDILICGHCHQQWHARANDTLIVNPGSVGISYIKGGYAPYSLLVFKDGRWYVEEKTVKYDPNKIREAFRKADIDNYSPWEMMLMHSTEDGKIATLAFLDYAKKYAISKGWDGKGGLIPNNYWLEAEKVFDWKNYEYEYK
ncbi:MAG: metallophosphoesterase family protein [Clostridiales bacterium]|nr:metallophosphoesterase family protein [Clostridiales bacterium]